MRRVIGATLCALMLMGALVASASAAAASQFRFTTSGPGVDAFWSTFPADGNVVPNVVYTDTFVSGAQQAVEDNGTTFTDKFAFIDAFSYKFDRKGNFVPVSDTFGFAGGTDVNLTVDSKLASATLQAAFALTTCTVRTCSDAGVAKFGGSWTATGAVVRVNGTTTVTSKGFTETSHSKGLFRDAVAVASLGGTSLGSSLGADINNTSFSDHFVCHGC